MCKQDDVFCRKKKHHIKTAGMLTIEQSYYQWRSYRGFRGFNEPGPPSSWGPPSQATKN